MSKTTDVNADTSVLFNYLYSSLLPLEIERDRDCRRLFEQDSFRVYAGRKAGEEFTNRVDKRYALYADITDFMLETDEEIFAYEPETRSVEASPGDESHLKKRIKWNSTILDADRAEQLSLVREIHQQLGGAAKQLLTDEIERVFSEKSHPELRSRFASSLGIGHDCDILVDAVFLCRDESIEILVAVDSDITDEEHCNRIEQIVLDVLDDRVPLKIVDPGDDSDGYLD